MRESKPELLWGWRSFFVVVGTVSAGIQNWTDLKALAEDHAKTRLGGDDLNISIPQMIQGRSLRNWSRS